MIGSINVTKPFKADFIENRPKAQKITEPIVSKTSICFSMLQNQAYLENRNYKTISFIRNCLKNTIITNPIVSESPRNRRLPKLNDGIGFS